MSFLFTFRFLKFYRNLAVREIRIRIIDSLACHVVYNLRKLLYHQLVFHLVTFLNVMTVDFITEIQYFHAFQQIDSDKFY